MTQRESHTTAVGIDKTAQMDKKGLAFIRSRVLVDGIAPSLRQIAKAVGYNSPRSVQLMLDRLEKRNLIRRAKGVIALTEPTKARKAKVDGRLRSVQFDEKGFPIYIFTDQGIYHVDFRKMKRNVED